MQEEHTHLEPIGAPATLPVVVLEEYLAQALGRPVRVRANTNRRRMISGSMTQGAPTLRVSIHQVFLRGDAPSVVWPQVARFLRDGDANSRRAVLAYAESQGTTDVPLIRPAEDDARGATTDLRAAADALNGEYFDGKLEFAIAWGQSRRPRRPLRSIQLGLWVQSQRLVRIHPILDAQTVPGYFRDFVIYHEMCHVVVPVRRGGHGEGRRVVHGRDFRQQELRYRQYTEAQRWQEANIGRLLRGWVL